MAFELITGHAGRSHVDSSDMGEAFAGIVGKGRYILDTGEGMACAMSDSNTLTVGTGSMLMDGRIVRNETAAVFKVANGMQGQYRHDLACLRYTLDRSNDSIESVEQVVLQGTPATTASEAKDPEYEAGDILSGDLSATVPIARVKLDNLTPTCEALLGSVTSLKSLGDSASQWATAPIANIPSGVKKFDASCPQVFRYNKRLRMLSADISLQLPGSNNPTYRNACTCKALGLPTPTREHKFLMGRSWKSGSGNNMQCPVTILANGDIAIDTRNAFLGATQHWNQIEIYNPIVFIDLDNW